MSIRAMGLLGIDKANRSNTGEHVLFMGHLVHVEGVATTGVVTDVVKDRGVVLPPTIGKRLNQPGINQSMDIDDIAHETDVTVAEAVACASPNPALAEGVGGINLNSGKEMVNGVTR